MPEATGASASASPETADNHFSTLDLPVDWALDEAELTARYLRAQQAVHPDRVAGASDAERHRAERFAANLNDAYRTLRSPLRRARHLLALRGVASDPASTVSADVGALSEQMAWRERLDAVSGDAAGRQALSEEASAAQRGCEADFEAAWQRSDLPTAASACFRMQFISQFIKRIAERDDAAGDHARQRAPSATGAP